MAFVVRPATPDDVDDIVVWTTDTFSWGDYVPDRLSSWLEDESSRVFVATVEGKPVALVHVLMLTSSEGWLEAARVHPDHRRAGLGKALNRAAMDWAGQRGAKVVRLATEAANQPAIVQVLKLGFRQTSSWAHAECIPSQPHDEHDVNRFRPGVGPDIDAAWVFWSSSELNRAGRGLIAESWQWRTASPNDLATGVGSGHFFQSPDGWLLMDQPETELLRILWMATAAEDAPRFLEGVMNLAWTKKVEAVSIKAPNLSWMTEAIRRVGGDPKEILIFSKSA